MTLRLSALALAASLAPLAAWADNGFLADARTGCKAWINNIDPGASIRWAGACEGGMASGRGALEYVVGGKVTAQMEGDFKNGKREGRVLVVYPDGRRFEGEYRNGMSNGRGFATWPDGDRFVGQYVDNQMQGRGVYTSASGSRYDGDYVGNERHGRGIYTDSEGSYEGEWANNKRNGRGIETWTNGARFEGEFRDGKPNGMGTYRGRALDGVIATWSGMWRDGCYSENGRTSAVLTTRKACGFE